MRILVDAMGGDNAPDQIALGAIQAAKDFGCEVVLVGRGEAILQALKDQGIETLPKGVEIVDLVVCGGVPTFKQVMDAVLAETEVEAYTIANEIEEKNPELLAYIQQSLPEAEESRIDHVDLKKMSAQCKFAIRTGEFTPYPNIILRAGVAFPA